MKTLYALALICLSVPALANELDFDGMPHDYAPASGYLHDAGADFNFGAENTATAVVPTTPDGGADFNIGDEITATIIVPATPKSEDEPLELGLLLDYDARYQHDTVALEAIPTDDWI